MFEVPLATQTILQPPRDVQLSAGMVLAALAIIVSFLVLGILTISIKLMSMGVLKYLSRREKKVKGPPTPVTEIKVPEVRVEAAPEVTPEEVAAAVTAVHRFIAERLRPAVPAPTARPVNYWVMTWRRDICINLNEYIYVLRSRKFQKYKRHLI